MYSVYIYIYIYIYIYLRHTTINCIPLLTLISESLQVHAASEKVHYLSTNLRLTQLRLTHPALEDCGYVSDSTEFDHTCQ